MLSRNQLKKIAEVYGGMPIWGCLPGSPCHRAGIVYGDILLEVNGRQIDNIEAYIAAKELDSNKFRVRFLRGGNEMEVTVPLEDPSWEEISRDMNVVRGFFSNDEKDVN